MDHPRPKLEDGRITPEAATNVHGIPSSARALDPAGNPLIVNDIGSLPETGTPLTPVKRLTVSPSDGLLGIPIEIAETPGMTLDVKLRTLGVSETITHANDRTLVNL